MTPLELLKQMEIGIAEINEASPKGMTPVQARELVEALEQFRRSITFTIDVWRENEVVILGAAGGSTMISPNTVAKVAPKRRERYDHGLIGRHVITHAIKEIRDGEVLFEIDDPTVAADRAVALMMELYVAEATEPKSGALKAIGFETKEAAMSSREVIGQQVKVRPR